MEVVGEIEAELQAKQEPVHKVGTKVVLNWYKDKFNRWEGGFGVYGNYFSGPEEATIIIVTPTVGQWIDLLDWDNGLDARWEDREWFQENVVGLKLSLWNEHDKAALKQCMRLKASSAYYIYCIHLDSKEEAMTRHAMPEGYLLPVGSVKANWTLQRFSLLQQASEARAKAKNLEQEAHALVMQ